MAVSIPTLQELIDQRLNDIATELNVSVDELGDTIRVEAAVGAGLLYQFYLAMSKVQNNVFPDLADMEILTRYGQVTLGRSPSPATSGIYQVSATGTPGNIIKAGTTFKANDDILAAGNLYVLDADVLLGSPTQTITVRALTPGVNSRLYTDDIITATSPIAGIDSEATYLSTITEPTAAETIDEYRDAVLLNYQLEPQGGSPSDYRLWALDVPEVRTVYTYVKDGDAGSIEIYIEATPENTAPGEAVGVPTQEAIDKIYKLDAGIETGAIVYNSDTNRGRKPLGIHNIYPLPVEPLDVDLEFENLSDESIIPIIETAIETLLYNVRPYVSGADNLINKNDLLTLSLIIATVINILTGTGITYTNLIMKVNSSIVNSYQFLKGEYPVLGTITNTTV